MVDPFRRPVRNDSILAHRASVSDTQNNDPMIRRERPSRG
ncbi:hypothetical protein SBD_1419 [Streptomyces bottropensis ATCC 25435]|uniref:Uncharacterized protein n=1 Tax=Streptomyces bottropensis ATCC 25435 TaxID=1054862 RepID=M3DK70_9ACTN|nr:hypothetical protein SBD_1419 [Streptomyces bottropensis ATCC 25435]